MDHTKWQNKESSNTTSPPSVDCRLLSPLTVNMEGNTRTLHQSKQKDDKISITKLSIQVNQLLEMIRESEMEREKLVEELEAMKIQVQTTQSDWKLEHKERLQAEEDKERARQVIVRLQEENWNLKKTRMVMRITK